MEGIMKSPTRIIQEDSPEKGDEFGELAEAFNSMAEKLDDYENSNLAKIISKGKNRCHHQQHEGPHHRLR